MLYAMVTYSFRRVCGGRTATLTPQTVRRSHGFYANRTVTSQFLAHCKVITSLVVFFKTWNFTFLYRNCNAATPHSHRKVTIRRPYGGLRWPWGDMRFLLCLGCRENLTASLRRPHGALTAAVRQSCGRCNSCGDAVTFVTKTTVARKIYNF